MKKCVIWTLVLVCLALAKEYSFAQNGDSKHRVYVDLGFSNGIAYEYNFAQKWQTRLTAGLDIGAGYSLQAKSLFFTGITPSLGAEIDWTYGRRGSEAGPFVSLLAGASLTKLSFLHGNSSPHERSLGLTLASGWGYKLPLDDKWSVSFLTGLRLSWGVYQHRTDYYVEHDKRLIPLYLTCRISYRI